MSFDLEHQIPCEICGQPTPYLGTKLCNGCYEFDKNFDRIINTDGGVAYIDKKLVEQNARVASARILRKIELEILGYEV